MRSSWLRPGIAGTAVLTLLVASASWAQAPAAETPPLEPRALEIVRRMSERLASTQRLRATIELAYDAVQRDGQLIEYGATRRLALRRPDRIRVDAVSRDGAHRTLMYDGRELALADAERNVYATVERTGDIDTALAYLHDELGVPTPLAELFSKDLPELLARESQSARWVDVQSIDGVACDHLAFRNPDTSLQLWVAAEGDPLPRRVVIVYERARGEPQFRADLRDWDLSPWLRDSLFAFEPPKGAERIYFRAGATIVPGVEGMR